MSSAKYALVFVTFISIPVLAQDNAQTIDINYLSTRSKEQKKTITAIREKSIKDARIKAKLEEIDNTFEKAEKFYNDGKLVEAAAFYSRVEKLSKDPEVRRAQGAVKKTSPDGTASIKDVRMEQDAERSNERIAVNRVKKEPIPKKRGVGNIGEKKRKPFKFLFF